LLPDRLQKLLKWNVFAVVMKADTIIPQQHVNAFSQAFFRKDDFLACAPLPCSP
jgi:hypothetical protein